MVCTALMFFLKLPTKTEVWSRFLPKEAWGYMSDFQIFGVAADAQQIRGIYDAGGGLLVGWDGIFQETPLDR